MSRWSVGPTQLPASAPADLPSGEHITTGSLCYRLSVAQQTLWKAVLDCCNGGYRL